MYGFSVPMIGKAIFNFIQCNFIQLFCSVLVPFEGRFCYYIKKTLYTNYVKRVCPLHFVKSLGLISQFLWCLCFLPEQNAGPLQDDTL